MFLKRIKLQNFKGLEDIEIPLEADGPGNRKWTLILGENGTGKSNLLKSIALVTAGSNALGELLGDTDSWIQYNQNTCSITAVLETKEEDERTITLVINRGDDLAQIIANNKDSLHLIDTAFKYSPRNYFLVAYGANRRLDTTTHVSRSSHFSPRTLNVKNLFEAASPLNPFTSWVIDLDYRLGEEGLTVIQELLDGFLPDTKFHSIDKQQKRLLFEAYDALVPLEQLSDGYQNMAAWIGDLLYRVTETFKDHKKPLETRGLLLIDEIDLHLHPSWQRRLIDFIGKKLPNFQIIATTHSPLTAQQAGENELYALKRNDAKKIEIIPFIGSPRKLLINQLLMTPVFGLPTDESVEVQNAKSEYESLKAKGDGRSPQEQIQMEEVSNILNKNLPQREFPGIASKEIALLEKIERQLNIK